MTRKLIYFLLGLVILGGIAFAQRAFDPNPVIAVCAYNAVLPTATSGQWAYVQCNSSGQLMVH